MAEEKIRTWKTIYAGTLAEGAACPYCGKRGYDNDDKCKHCGMHVAPRLRLTAISSIRTDRDAVI